MVFAAETPIRQAYLNDMIPSRQRATVLSFASSMGSIGGVVIQPALAKVADAYSYATSRALGGAIQLISAPFLYLSRRERAAAGLTIDAFTPPTPRIAQEPVPSTASGARAADGPSPRRDRRLLRRPSEPRHHGQERLGRRRTGLVAQLPTTP